MTPQSNFMVVAPIAPDRIDDLRRLVGSMNKSAGVFDPQNALLPLGRFEQLHFARIVVLEDPTADDIVVYGLPKPNFPTYLTFLGDIDGSPDIFLAELSKCAAGGLRQIFSHCTDFNPSADLLQWMTAHNLKPSTAYVNWTGRTVKQTREEDALRQTLERYIQENQTSLQAMPPARVRDTLQSFAKSEQQAGRIVLTADAPTPLGWRIRNLINLIGVPLILLLLTPFLLIYAPIFLIQLRRREKSDPVIAPRIDPAHASVLAVQEDREVTNQFNAFGSIKPGAFRRWTLVFLLWVIDYTTRHIYKRGRLARVSTIHCARWVFLDDRKRVYFASNYDGSLDNYMDDFINKVGFGLNIVFGNGVGYPTTSWMVAGGAKDEQKFKYVLRRHQQPSEIWYNAHRGLTALNLQRNSLIRDGLEKSTMTDSETQQWLQLF
jgi:hypothetical protein